MRDNLEELSEARDVLNDETEEEQEQEAWDPELARQRASEQGYYVMLAQADTRASMRLGGLPIEQLRPFITHFQADHDGHFSMKLSQEVKLEAEGVTLTFGTEVEGDMTPGRTGVEHVQGVRVGGAAAGARADEAIVQLMFAGDALKGRSLEGGWTPEVRLDALKGV